MPRIGLLLLLALAAAHCSVGANQRAGQQRAGGTDAAEPMQQTRPAIVPSGGRQKRPLAVAEEEEAAGGFIMRSLASAASSQRAQEAAAEETVPQAANEASNSERAQTVNQTPAAGALDSSEQRSAEESSIAIEPKRKMFLTHDQLNRQSTNLTNQEDVSSSWLSSPSMQQAPRAGMSRLSYASSFLSGE